MNDNTTIPLLTPCCGKPVESIKLDRPKLLDTNRECVCGKKYRVHYAPGQEPEWEPDTQCRVADPKRGRCTRHEHNHKGPHCYPGTERFVVVDVGTFADHEGSSAYCVYKRGSDGVYRACSTPTTLQRATDDAEHSNLLADERR